MSTSTTETQLRAKSLYNSIAAQINQALTDIDKIEVIEKIKKQYSGTQDETDIMHCIAQILESKNMLKFKNDEDNSKNSMDTDISNTQNNRRDLLKKIQKKIKKDQALTLFLVLASEEGCFIKFKRNHSSRDGIIPLDKDAIEFLLSVFEQNAILITVLLEISDNSTDAQLLLLDPILNRFFSIVFQNQTVIHFEISFSDFESKKGLLKYLAIPAHTKILTSLCLDNMNDTDTPDYDNILTTILKINHSITDLNFSGEGDGCSGMQKTEIQTIGEALVHNNTVTRVDLGYCSFYKEHYEIFLEVVRKNGHLTSLMLSEGEAISPELLKNFFEALIPHKTLKNFGFNKCLEDDFNLRDLDTIWDRSGDVCDKFLELLRRNEILTNLHTGYWHDARSIESIAKELNDNHSLTTLTLPLVCITFTTAFKFLETLRKNKYLLSLQIQDENYHLLTANLCQCRELVNEQFDSCKIPKCLQVSTGEIQRSIDDILAKNTTFRFYWSRVSILIAFARANANNCAPMRQSIVPLIQKVLNLAEIKIHPKHTETTVPETKQLSEIIRTRYFQACINIISTSMQSTMTTMSTSSSSGSSSSSTNTPLNFQFMTTPPPMPTETQPAAAAVEASTTTTNSNSSNTSTRNVRKRRH